MAGETVEGPSWVPHHLDVRAGLFPLSVEGHLLNMTARLVPAVTTVTTKSRYYALHGLLALEVERRQLDLEDAYALLRRCEVVVAGASIVHPDAATGVAHGEDRVRQELEADGAIDLSDLATPGTGYAKPRWGFLGTYAGSEVGLGILADNRLSAGPRLDEATLGTSFTGLFDLASEDTVTQDQLEACPNLAVGAGRHQPDGVWLARLFCAVGVVDRHKIDDTRRGTVRLLVRALAMASELGVEQAFRTLVAYGSALRTDRVAVEVTHAEAWRGTVFRHDSVGAWRTLWSWLVSNISGNTPPSELVEATVGLLPRGTLADFVAGLPATLDPAGDPAPAEDQVRAAGLSAPEESLALLVLGARRSDELEGHARAALVGEERPVVLTPLWMKQWVEDRMDRALADVGAELVEVVLDRARRIALRKMRVHADGTIWLPTRVHERGDLLYKVGDERKVNVGLRINQLANILGGVGVLDWNQGRWQVPPFGDDLLDVVAS